MANRRRFRKAAVALSKRYIAQFVTVFTSVVALAPAAKGATSTYREAVVDFDAVASLKRAIEGSEVAPSATTTGTERPVPACLVPPPPLGSLNAPTTASATGCVDQPPQLEVHWDSQTLWMGGNPISGGKQFYNSIGTEMIGQISSNLTSAQYVPIEIHLDPAETTLCQVFHVETNYAPAGVGVFPGSAWDITDPSNPRRLNLCFTEWNDGAGPVPPPNLFWDPDTTRTSPRFGKFEFLFVMNSSYDGTGTTYAAVNPHTTPQDMLYFWYPRLEPGHTWFESLPFKLKILIFRDYVTDAFATAADRQLTLNWTYCGAGLHQGFHLLRDLVAPPVTPYVDIPAGTSSFIDSNLTNGLTYYYQLVIYGPNDSTMGFSSNFYGTPEKVFDSMSVVGRWYAPESFGGIWGYVGPGGHEYALITSRNANKVHVIDIDATVPTEVATLPGYGDTKEVKTYLNYAVVVSENGPLNIYDISGLPSQPNPPLVGIVHPGNNGSHNCLVDGHYLYVVGNHFVGGLEIFDIINPASPVKVGEFQPFYYHDVTMRHDTLYCYGIYGQGIDILNVSNKTAPSLISHFNYPGSGSHNGELSADGKYLFIGDEIGSGPWTRTFDVSDPLNVSFKNNIIVDPASTAHNCYRRGNILYIAHYGRGVRAWDVSNPLAPHEVGFYDTQPGANATFGAWTAYPMPSGRIVASDMGNGLYVLTFDGYQAPICDCSCVGDPVCDQSMDVLDVVSTINIAFRGASPVSGGPNCSVNGTDMDCSGVTDVLDVVTGINVAFRGNPSNWVPCSSCSP